MNDKTITVAVVFREKIYGNFLGYPIVDGERSDLRFLDPSPSVVALKAKSRAKQDVTGFVL